LENNLISNIFVMSIFQSRDHRVFKLEGSLCKAQYLPQETPRTSGWSQATHLTLSLCILSRALSSNNIQHIPLSAPAMSSCFHLLPFISHTPPCHYHQLLILTFHIFVAPATLPTMLYRLLKKVNHSASTVLFSSFRSAHSGTQSSAFSDEVASAREGSLPANT